MTTVRREREGLSDPAGVDPLDDTQQMDREEIGLAGTMMVDGPGDPLAGRMADDEPVNPMAGTMVIEAPVSPNARTLQLPPDPARVVSVAPRPVVGDAVLSEAAGRAEPLGVIVRRIHLIEG